MKTTDLSQSSPASCAEEFPPKWIRLLDELPLRERAEAYGISLDPIHQIEADLAVARQERDRAIQELPRLKKRLDRKLQRKFRRYSSAIKMLSFRMKEELRLIDEFYRHHERSPYDRSWPGDRKHFFSLPDWICTLHTGWINCFRKVRAGYHKGWRESLRSQIVRLHKRSYRDLQKLCAKPAFPKAYLRYCSHKFWFIKDPNEASPGDNYFGYQIAPISIKKIYDNIDWFIGNGVRSSFDIRLCDSLWKDNELLCRCQDHHCTVDSYRVRYLQNELKTQTRKLQRKIDKARDEKIAIEMQKRIDAVKQQSERLRDEQNQAERDLREAADREFERFKVQSEQESTETINDLERQLDQFTNPKKNYEKLREDSPGGDQPSAGRNSER